MACCMSFLCACIEPRTVHTYVRVMCVSVDTCMKFSCDVERCVAESVISSPVAMSAATVHSHGACTYSRASSVQASEL